MDIDSINLAIYNNYKFLGITYDEYSDIIKKMNIIEQKNYKGNKPYNKYVKDIIIMQMNKIVRSVFKDEKKAYYIINKYIDDNLNISDNCNDAINSVNQLISLLHMINYIPEPDFLVRLFNENMILNSLMETIVGKYLNVIKSGKIYNFFSDNLFVMFIEVYANKKGIEIEDSEDETFSDDLIEMYLNDIRDLNPLSQEEVIDLCYKIKNGDKKARNKFIEHNLKLVIKFGKRYFSDSSNILDVIQDGNMGLIEAVKRYDISKGYRFSTYARWWILQSILSNSSFSNTNIKISTAGKSKIKKYKEAKEKLENMYHREPTINEIASELNIPVDSVYDIINLQRQVISLDDTITVESDESTVEFVPSEDRTPDEEVELNMLVEEVRDLFDKCGLTEEEIKVLEYRFGLNGRNANTLEEIAKYFDVTRERIRQIEAKALWKLRKSKYTKEFASYIDRPDIGMERLKQYAKAYRKNINNRFRTDPLKKRNGR